LVGFGQYLKKIEQNLDEILANWKNLSKNLGEILANLIRFGQNQNIASAKNFDLLRLCHSFLVIIAGTMSMSIENNMLLLVCQTISVSPVPLFIFPPLDKFNLPKQRHYDVIKAFIA